MNDIIFGEPTTLSNKKRDIALDYAKGFAIILIVVYHLYGYTGRWQGSVIYSFCHTVQLPIFFYVSGVLTSKNTTVNINLKKKFTRLIIPFLFFYFIWCFINFQNIRIFVLEEFKGGYWFTLVLFEMMVFYSISFKLSQAIQVCPQLTLLGLFLILSFPKYLFPKDNIVYITLSTNLFWHYFPFFYLGIIHSYICKVLKLKFSILFFILFCYTQYIYYTSNIKIMIPLCNLFSLLFFATLYFNNIRPYEEKIANIGRYSLQIYLLHFFLVHYFSDFIPTISNKIVECVLFFFISLIFIIFIIMISNILLRNKCTRLLFFGLKQ